MKNKTFFLINLGCRVNLFESTAIKSQLIAEGYKESKTLEKVNVAIINTCSVTSKADRKSRNFISKVVKSKPMCSIVVGCFSQLNYKFVADLGVNIVLGNKYKNQIVDFINLYNKDKKQIVKIENLFNEEVFEKFPIHSYNDKSRNIIKIQDGCNYMCSYCLIPFLRGKQRSLDKEQIINTIIQLTKDKYCEIILTGVNTAGYRDKDYLFIDLLQDINKISGNFRVRISSIEPFQINPEMVSLITKNKNRWVQHFHICLQSASDRVLKEMNRKYSIKSFIKLCKLIKQQNEYASITTDYIVGFPTETKEDFTASMKELEEIKFSDMNIFPFSTRKMTKCSRIKNNVTPIQKKNRWNTLNSKANEWKYLYLKKFINKTVDVFFEKARNKGIQHGHSEYFFVVFVKTTKNLTSTCKKVIIKKIVDGKVYGELF